MREDIARLAKKGGRGVELGVAAGNFSRRLLETGHLGVLYSVDRWSDHHDDREYHRAVALLSKFGDKSHIIRDTFERAALQFPQGFFDFIYIDGYAHTGEDEGKTLDMWWSKLKDGGVFAGDDYDPQWPLVVQVVDAFAEKHGKEVKLHKFPVEDPTYDKYPTWWIRK